MIHQWMGMKLAFRICLRRRWRLCGVSCSWVCACFSGTNLHLWTALFSSRPPLAQILRLERRQPTGGTLLQLTRVTVEVNDASDVRFAWLAVFYLSMLFAKSPAALRARIEHRMSVVVFIA